MQDWGWPKVNLFCKTIRTLCLELEKDITEKTLYDYQIADLNTIFEHLAETDAGNLLYQLPTGGGKTVVFSEIARRYIEEKKKKVVVLTHRIELSVQTSTMLSGFG